VLILTPAPQTFTMFYIEKLLNFLLLALSPELTLPFQQLQKGQEWWI
jgi:hypothetical protein